MIKHAKNNYMLGVFILSLMIFGTDNILGIFENMMVLHQFIKISQTNKENALVSQTDQSLYFTIMIFFKLLSCVMLMGFALINYVINMFKLYVLYNMYSEGDIIYMIDDKIKRVYYSNRYIIKKGDETIKNAVLKSGESMNTLTTVVAPIVNQKSREILSKVGMDKDKVNLNSIHKFYALIKEKSCSVVNVFLKMRKTSKVQFNSPLVEKEYIIEKGNLVESNTETCVNEIEETSEEICNEKTTETPKEVCNEENTVETNVEGNMVVNNDDENKIKKAPDLLLFNSESGDESN